MDYYLFGLLCDFLKFYILIVDIMMNFVLLVLKGLFYFYIEIQGIIVIGKFVMVYCDISSNNILVQVNFICCLVDFGFVVRYLLEMEEIDVIFNRMVGIWIYMVLEVLGDIMNFSNIGVFKMVDIYFFGFVLWEINRRCCLDGKNIFFIWFY